jgi:NAD+ synthase (glutamine-hydrolysing)
LLAKNLGIKTLLIPIEDHFRQFIVSLNEKREPVLDLAEENLQARIRGNILMFISNRDNRMLLTTSNKSELAVGYCTLYGDMCGGLSALADLPKLMVYRLADYINHLAGKDLIPREIIEKPPSAELRPDQLDQDSLPPYEILDGLLHYYIEENMSIDEIAALGFDRALAASIAAKVDRAEYKRSQAAPALRITSRAFGSGRRMPIVRGYS